MACLTENQLLVLFSPARTPALAAEVDAHTATCGRCRELVAQYAQLSAENGTAHTHRPESQPPVAVPSLTPGVGAPGKAAEVAPAAPLYARKLVGSVLKGKWHVDRLLGSGGMAYVFAATHRNGRKVAIKVMRPDLVEEPSLVERFLREGYVANKVEHPGTVAILDDDVMDDGTPFLVMELLSGRSLRQKLADGPMPLAEALEATAAVLDVLAVAHDKGIIHRDLKPDNLFLTDDGVVKVLDFGIARLRERTRSQYETQTGTTMGTVGFMPPEQARGLTNEIDARSDVWAIGATLFSLLTGRAVHEAATANEALLLAMTKPVPPMSELLPALAPPVKTVMDRALSFQREDRYPSARAMKEALEAARVATTRSSSLPVFAPPPAAAMTAPVFTPPQPGVPATTPAPRLNPDGTMMLGPGSRPPAAAAFTVAPAEASPTMLARAMSRRGSASVPPESVKASSRVALVMGSAALAAVLLAVLVVTLVRGESPSAPRASAGTGSTSAVVAAEPLPGAAIAPAATPSATESAAPIPIVVASPGAAAHTASTAKPVTTKPTPKPTASPKPSASAVATAAPSPPRPEVPPPPATPPRDPLGPRR